MKTNRKLFPQICFSMLVLALSIFATGCQALPENPPPTVDRVDLERYTGLWYELARLPVPFQEDNERATAEYRLRDDGTIDLINTAIKPDGSTRSVTGTAVPVPGSNNSRLRVTIDNFFAELFGSPPDYGNYWVLKLAPDYSIALVGSPDRDSLWLLAREKTIPLETMQRYMDRAAELGYSTDAMIVHNHHL
jgi:apolipoprotein D and lipocalin family protein